MKASTPRAILLTALLAGAPVGCGGGERADAAGRSGSEGAPQVYTSEVETVSQWIGESGAGDSLELMAAKNPRGEGVVVYARGKDAAGDTQTAAWMVVDSQVVPLNRASRRITPKLPAGTDERTWSRIGITRPTEQGDADLRDIIPPTRPAERTQPRQEPRPPAARAEEPKDSGAQVPRTIDTRDTVRIPATPAPRDTSTVPPPGAPQPKPEPAARPRPPRDTLVIPASPAVDTSRSRRTEPAPTSSPPQTGAEKAPTPVSSPPARP
ncbi:MAG TPA: hypothetical protein VHG28_12015 [Longimicrobiaceae bacterium]|nr:hypothetical protein [Longimicrobiaceae bacterium]